jgi:hypothetical protein
MAPSITIVRYPYEEPYALHLDFLASNGPLRGRLEIYVHSQELVALAEVLEVFPRHDSDEHSWELGSERPGDWAYYFRFRLFLIDKAGACGIELRGNNNQDLPYREIWEFCISAEPSALNRLGRLFRGFARLEDEVLHWTPTEGQLYETLGQAQEEGIVEA